MSAPEATDTRQRTPHPAEEDVKTQNPASLSANPKKTVPRKQPLVKPLLIDVPMNRFLNYLILGLLAVAAFYGWRFTVWAGEVGGYWNLITGHRSFAVPSAAELAAQATAHAKSGGGKASTPQGQFRQGKAAADDVQSQIFNLAAALGVKPADLSEAIRPLIDPSAPNPAEAARREAELMRAKIEAQEKPGEAQQNSGSLLDVVGEALLD